MLLYTVMKFLFRISIVIERLTTPYSSDAFLTTIFNYSDI